MTITITGSQIKVDGELFAPKLVVQTVALGASGNTITHAFESGYDYILEIEDAIPLTDATTPFLRVNGDSGSNYRWGMQQKDDVNTSSDANDTSDTEIHFVGGFGIGTGTGEGFNASLRLRSFSSTSLHKVVSIFSEYKSASGRSTSVYGAGVWLNTAAVTSIFIGCTGATPHFASGIATLYRSKRS